MNFCVRHHDGIIVQESGLLVFVLHTIHFEKDTLQEKNQRKTRGKIPRHSITMAETPFFHHHSLRYPFSMTQRGSDQKASLPGSNERLGPPWNFKVVLPLLVLFLVGGCLRPQDPISPRERQEIIAEDRKQLFTKETLATEPIDLFEAMARALKYNLEYRIVVMDQTLRQESLDVTRFSLLPRLTATAGYANRDKYAASSGMSLNDGLRSSIYSVSQDRAIRSADLTMIWNMLDFGISAVQVDQEQDMVRIAQENRRKAVHNLLQEVRSAFWRAAGAQQLADQIPPVMAAASEALDNARKVEDERLKPQLEMLRFQRALMDIVQQLDGLRNELEKAQTEFATLIHLPPGTPFRLAIPDDEALAIPPIGISIEEMETLGLLNRPESREKIHQARIDKGEIKKAMLRLLPGVEIDLSNNYDSNSFALHRQWEALSSQVIINLIELFKGPQSIQLAEDRAELGRLHRLAMDMAILTQIHLAWHQYQEDVRKLKWAENIDAIDQRILHHVGTLAGENTQTRLEHIHAAAGAIFSRLQLYQTYAEAQNSVGRMFVSIGVDLSPTVEDRMEVADLARHLREATREWNEGIASQSEPLRPLIPVYDSAMDLPAPGETVAPPPQGAQPRPKVPDYLLKPGFSVTASLSEVNHAVVPEPEQEHAVEDQPSPEEPEPEQVPPAEEKPSPKPKADPVLPAGENPLPASSQPRKEVVQAPSPPTKMAPPPEKAPPEPEETPRNPPKPAAAEPHPGKTNTVHPDGNQPRIPTPHLNTKAAHVPLPPADLKEVWTLIETWSKAWSQRDIEGFAACYSPNFIPLRENSLAEWKERMAGNFKLLNSIQIMIDNLELFPRNDHRIEVTFTQSYRSDRYHEIADKLLILEKTAAGWKIIGEIATPLREPDAGPAPKGFAVQILAVRDEKGLQDVRGQLERLGLKPYVETRKEADGGVWHALKCGPFEQINQAKWLQLKLKKEHSLTTLIVPAP